MGQTSQSLFCIREKVGHMIVRIMAEDQYRLDDSHRAQIERLDEAAEVAMNAGDEAAFPSASA